MRVKRAYQYRFYPTDEQAHNLACTFGCARFMYNWALSKRKQAYLTQGITLSTKDLSAAMTDLKKAERGNSMAQRSLRCALAASFAASGYGVQELL
ncbi:MAG TPA: helix-turn-helix domain-containing protein [Ktedonobacteraceae bacterium]|jgi:putative transposase